MARWLYWPRYTGHFINTNLQIKKIAGHCSCHNHCINRHTIYSECHTSTLRCSSEETLPESVCSATHAADLHTISTHMTCVHIQDCIFCNHTFDHAGAKPIVIMLPQMAEVWMIMGELVQACCVRMAFMGRPEDNRPNCCPAVLGGMNTFSGLMPIMWSSKSAAVCSVVGVGVGCCEGGSMPCCWASWVR